MTTDPSFAISIPLVAGLSRGLPENERYHRLLQTLRDLLSYDAIVLLCLGDERLTPLAVNDLSPDTLGRRFRVGEHPRFEALLRRRGSTRFPTDCGLPNPYGGLVEGLHSHLETHNCLSCLLYLDDQSWGSLTLDTLDLPRFVSADPDTLEAFASLTIATVKTSERMRDLARRAEEGHQRAKAYFEAAGEQPQEMTGQSAAYKALLKEIRLVVNNDLGVLITGKTGVDKELVAQSIHRHSTRSGRPVVSLDYATLLGALAESESLDHMHGALSDVINERRDKFELVGGGSLFLDEADELPLIVQAKLLHVLQSGQLQRVGSDRERRVDACLIAATNHDLAEEAHAGRFRADLHHRLSVYPLHVSPLHERGRDTLLLAGCFLEGNRPRLGLRSLRLDHEVQTVLLDYRWSGNVREFEHLVGCVLLKAFGHNPERSRIVTLHRWNLDLSVETPALPHNVAEPAPATPVTGHSLCAATDAYRRHLIQDCLIRHQGSWVSATRELGPDCASLARLARRL